MRQTFFEGCDLIILRSVCYQSPSLQNQPAKVLLVQMKLYQSGPWQVLINNLFSVCILE